MRGFVLSKSDQSLQFGGGDVGPHIRDLTQALEGEYSNQSIRR